MPELNLLESRLKDTTYARERQIKVALSGLVVVLLVLVGAGVLLLVMSNSLQQSVSSVTISNQSLRQKLKEKEPILKQATTYQAQLTNLGTLLRLHTYFVPLLDELEKTAYKKSQYFSVSVSGDGSVHLNGTTPSYRDLGKLILGLSTSPNFKDVKLGSVGASGDAKNSYRFSAEMDVVPEIFINK